MLNEQLSRLMVEQVNKELYSAYLYLSMSNFYDEKGLKGIAFWFKKQAEEEYEHAIKFMNYLHDQNEKVTLPAIEAPKGEFSDLKEPLILQLNHERFVTASINNIYKVATENNDYRSLKFLDWFIEEQAEEERVAQDLLEEFEHVSVDSRGIFEFSERAGARRK